MTIDQKYIHRCIELAKMGAGYVAPNPMAGAVLVYKERIIGEGYHQQYGHAHAEVNCINSVREEDKNLINASTLYISLEPCVHYGKTPPCTDLIITNRIKKVIIGCLDPYKEVAGKGIEKLMASGISVITGILEDECISLNKRFFIFHTKQRPYIILKWAQTANHKIAANGNERLLISNEYTNRLVHKWRSEEAAVMTGTNTALLDNPSLTTRFWKGNNAVRLIIDMNLRLPGHLTIFDADSTTIIFNNQKHTIDFNNTVNEINNGYYKISEEKNILQQIMDACFRLNIQSILIEGGAKLLQNFIDTGLWDEARVITNEKLIIAEGLAANALQGERLTAAENIFTDRINYYERIE